jgi:hypothetical protein
MSETSAMYASDVDDGLPFSFFLAIIIPLWWLYNQRERDIASEIKCGRRKEAPPRPPDFCISIWKGVFFFTPYFFKITTFYSFLCVSKYINSCLGIIIIL